MAGVQKGSWFREKPDAIARSSVRAGFSQNQLLAFTKMFHNVACLTCVLLEDNLGIGSRFVLYLVPLFPLAIAEVL